MSEVLDRNAKGACESKISQLKHSFTINQEVLRFKITMKDLMFVALCSSVEELIQKGHDLVLGHLTLVVIQKFLEVLIKEFENKREFFVGVQHVYEFNNVRMLKFLKQGNFSDGSAWNTFIL